MLPAAIVGMASIRRARFKVVVVGALFGLSVLLGSMSVLVGGPTARTSPGAPITLF